MKTNVVPMRYDLSTCDKEPIHRLGKIHSSGFLLALSADWLVVAFSENLPALFNQKREEMLGQPLADLFQPTVVTALSNIIKRLDDVDQIERTLGLQLFNDTRRFDLSVHFSSELLIVEFSASAEQKSTELADTLRVGLRRLGKAQNSVDLCLQASETVARMTGFDRVMVYKFHPDGSGEVIAEHRQSDIDSFLGLRYPPSDIPQQARALYKRSILRIIPSVTDPGIALFPPDAEVDLSLASLRSVSPIHVEYLKNMGVEASMSISILIDGELWGLIACHHYAAHECLMDCKTYTELYAESFALELRSQLSREASQGAGGAQKLHMSMIASLDPSITLLENLSSFGTKIKALVECDSLILSIDGERSVIGDPVSSEDIDLLVKRLNRQATTRVTAIENLQNWLDEDVTVAERFAGVLAVPISKRPRDLLLFLRKEERSEVNWAGNPEKPVELGPNGSRLTPRKSFAAWRQLREGFCKPWSPQDLNLANELRGTLLELVVRNIEERNKLATESQHQQDMLIHELNHRVRNILGLINSIIGQTATSVASVSEFKDILAGRIQALALAQNMLTERNWENTPFTSLLETELSAFVTQPERIEAEGPEVLLTPKAYTTLTLLIHELITNAIKHGALSNSSGKIEINWSIDSSSNLVLNWRETGVTIERAPERRGFGSLIIERAVPLDLGGESNHKVTRDGLIASFLIPSKHVGYEREELVPPELNEEQTQTSAPSSDAASSQKDETLGQALIVEDNMIIALDEESSLLSMGFSEVQLAATVASAMQILARGGVKFAILDINLGLESSEPIAEELKRRGTPFIFASGYDEGLVRLREKFAAPLLKKPFTGDGLIAFISDYLEQIKATQEG